MLRKALYLTPLVLAAAQLYSYCEKCEIIREANKKLPPQKHEYYEDYLKELEEEKKEEAEKIEFIKLDFATFLDEDAERGKIQRNEF